MVKPRPEPKPKLTTGALSPPFHVVLVEPEIPPNTGSIARTCAATSTPLHLVGQLGFRIDEHSIRRAGLDYWHLVDLHTHESFDDFLASRPTESRPRERLALFSASSDRSYLDAAFQPGDSLVFGKESVGLAPELLAEFPDRVFAIPTSGAVRSLNLSNAVAIVLYEALRQVGALSGGRLAQLP